MGTPRESSEPLALIHGFSGTGRISEPVGGSLERSFEVVTVNLAGRVREPAAVGA